MLLTTNILKFNLGMRFLPGYKERMYKNFIISQLLREFVDTLPGPNHYGMIILSEGKGTITVRCNPQEDNGYWLCIISLVTSERMPQDVWLVPSGEVTDKRKPIRILLTSTKWPTFNYSIINTEGKVLKEFNLVDFA